MRDVSTVRLFISVNMLVVIRANLILRNIGMQAKLLEIEKRVLYDAPLWNVVARFILLEICRKVGVAGFDFGLQIIGFDNYVADLDLLVAPPEFLFHFRRRNGHPVGNEFTELLLEQSLTH